MLRFWSWITEWLDAPSLLARFRQLPSESDVLELTPDMIWHPDPFGRFKRKLDASR